MHGGYTQTETLTSAKPLGGDRKTIPDNTESAHSSVQLIAARNWKRALVEKKTSS